MDDRHPLSRVARPVEGSGASTRETNVTLSPYLALQRDLGAAYQKYIGYAEIIARGGPLAPQFGDSIFYSEVDRTAARIFGSARPRLVEGSVQTPITWTDVLRQMLTPGDFQRQANGMYRCRVRGSLIEVSEANYMEILTGVTERLLQPLQNLSNEQKETRVRLKLGSYLHQTHNTLIQFVMAVRASIDALNRTVTIQGADPNTTGRAEAQLPIPISARRPDSSARGVVANSSFTGRHEAQLPTPISAQRPVSSAPVVIYISDTDSDSDEKTGGNIKTEAPESAQSERVGIVENNRAESMRPETNELVKVESSEVVQGESIVSTSDTDYVPSIDVFQSNLSDSVSETDDYVSSTDGSRRISTGSESDSDDDAPSIGVFRGNSNDSDNDENDAGLVAYDILRLANSLVNDNNEGAGLVDSNTPSATNNHAVENTDANTNANANANADENTNANENTNVNANAEPSGLASDVASDTIRPWLLNINTPGNADDDAHSSGSDIPWKIKSGKRSHSTDTAEGLDGIPSHGSKRRRAESPFSESGNKPRAAAKRYSQLEEDEGPAFVKSLVNRGSTGAEIEQEYSQVFGVFRSAGALFKKFETKGTWALLKSHRQATQQKTMSA